MTRTVTEINAISKADLERRLERAIARAQAEALERRMYGILVTRQSFSHFTVTLSAEVPFGSTYEHDELVIGDANTVSDGRKVSHFVV